MNASPFAPQILPERRVIRVAGEGALAFLHNLLTVDLLQLSPGEAAYGALLTPQGKVLHDMFIVAAGDCVFLDCAAEQTDALLGKLHMYRLRAKLEIAVDLGKAVAVSSAAGLPGQGFADPRLATMGQRAIVEAGSLPGGSGYDAARLVHGLADSAADIGSGELFVHEANLDQLHGVSFSKGCYVGQEVVSRTHHRGTARSRILPVTCDGKVERGADVSSSGTRMGTMLSYDGRRGLALLRLDRLAEATAPLLTGAVTLYVHKPAWATFELTLSEVMQ